VIKHKFSKIEFYVTNVCNLSCEGCNRFNNYNFSGWQRWSDLESVYQRWADHIEIDHMVLLGGEPLLNPDIMDWIYGLNRVFKTNVQILSNGTRINKVAGLYEALQVNGNWMGISWHNPETLDEFDHEVRQFLKGDVIKVDKDHPENTFGAHMMWMDSNGVKIPLWVQYEFYASAIKPTDHGRLTLHQSDPARAHNSCGFAKFKNYHFINGKLYKCGPVALFPEFDQQHSFDISEDDRKLINSYTPLTVDGYVSHGDGYFDQLDQPLAQCKFCPENLDYKYRLFAVSKNKAKKQINLEPI
jgi:hypothetical protein